MTLSRAMEGLIVYISPILCMDHACTVIPAPSLITPGIGGLEEGDRRGCQGAHKGAVRGTEGDARGATCG